MSAFALHNNIVCRLCLEQFNSNNRLPKILPCLHTFCLRCLDDLIPRKLTSVCCPICRKRIIIPNKRAANLPNNLAVRDILDEVQHSMKEKLKCKYHHGKQCVVICMDCLEGLCFDCMKHISSGSHATHTIEEMIEAKEILRMKFDCVLFDTIQELEQQSACLIDSDINTDALEDYLENIVQDVTYILDTWKQQQIEDYINEREKSIQDYVCQNMTKIKELMDKISEPDITVPYMLKKLKKKNRLKPVSFHFCCNLDTLLCYIDNYLEPIDSHIYCELSQEKDILNDDKIESHDKQTDVNTDERNINKEINPETLLCSNSTECLSTKHHTSKQDQVSIPNQHAVDKSDIQYTDNRDQTMSVKQPIEEKFINPNSELKTVNYDTENLFFCGKVEHKRDDTENLIFDEEVNECKLGSEISLKQELHEFMKELNGSKIENVEQLDNLCEPNEKVESLQEARESTIPIETLANNILVNENATSEETITDLEKNYDTIINTLVPGGSATELSLSDKSQDLGHFNFVFRFEKNVPSEICIIGPDDSIIHQIRFDHIISIFDIEEQVRNFIQMDIIDPSGVIIKSEQYTIPVKLLHEDNTLSIPCHGHSYNNDIFSQQDFDSNIDKEIMSNEENELFSQFDDNSRDINNVNSFDKVVFDHENDWDTQRKSKSSTEPEQSQSYNEIKHSEECFLKEAKADIETSIQTDFEQSLLSIKSNNSSTEDMDFDIESLNCIVPDNDCQELLNQDNPSETKDTKCKSKDISFSGEKICNEIKFDNEWSNVSGPLDDTSHSNPRKYDKANFVTEQGQQENLENKAEDTLNKIICKTNQRCGSSRKFNSCVRFETNSEDDTLERDEIKSHGCMINKDDICTSANEDFKNERISKGKNVCDLQYNRKVASKSDFNLSFKDTSTERHSPMCHCYQFRNTTNSGLRDILIVVGEVSICCKFSKTVAKDLEPQRVYGLWNLSELCNEALFCIQEVHDNQSDYKLDILSMKMRLQKAFIKASKGQLKLASTGNESSNKCVRVWHVIG